MSDWLKLGGDGNALNMAQVASVGSPGLHGEVAVKTADGRMTLYYGDEARRVLAWLDAHAELPVLVPGPER